MAGQGKKGMGRRNGETSYEITIHFSRIHAITHYTLRIHAFKHLRITTFDNPTRHPHDLIWSGRHIEGEIWRVEFVDFMYF